MSWHRNRRRLLDHNIARYSLHRECGHVTERRSVRTSSAFGRFAARKSNQAASASFSSSGLHVFCSHSTATPFLASSVEAVEVTFQDASILLVIWLRGWKVDGPPC